MLPWEGKLAKDYDPIHSGLLQAAASIDGQFVIRLWAFGSLKGHPFPTTYEALAASEHACGA